MNVTQQMIDKLVAYLNDHPNFELLIIREKGGGKDRAFVYTLSIIDEKLFSVLRIIDQDYDIRGGLSYKSEKPTKIIDGSQMNFADEFLACVENPKPRLIQIYS